MQRPGFLVVLAGLALLAGCDTQEMQEAFERAAFATPSGFTRTDADGQILSDDRDDWRTAPVYAGRVLVNPAFPNPTTGDEVKIPLSVREFNAVPGGLELVSFDATNRPFRLDLIPEARDPGAYVFIFNPSILGVRGLVRVFIFDGSGGLVSYGDILIDT